MQSLIARSALQPGPADSTLLPENIDDLTEKRVILAFVRAHAHL